MNLQQCINMHYYDGDLHAECPYCKHPEKQQYQYIIKTDNRTDRVVTSDSSIRLFDGSNDDDDRTELQL